MIGYAVCIRRDDGSLYFAIPGHGFSTPVFFEHGNALENARALRDHRLDAVVVKVDYKDPEIIGPARHVGALS